MQPEMEPVRQSFLSWLFQSLGLGYAVLLPLAGLFSFFLVLVIVIRGRGPFAGVALVLICHVPMLVGIFAAIQGAIISYSVIAMSSNAPKPSEVAAGISAALIAPMVGMVMMVPAYATAAVGATARSLFGRERTTVR